MNPRYKLQQCLSLKIELQSKLLILRSHPTPKSHTPVLKSSDLVCFHSLLALCSVWKQEGNCCKLKTTKEWTIVSLQSVTATDGIIMDADFSHWTAFSLFFSLARIQLNTASHYSSLQGGDMNLGSPNKPWGGGLGICDLVVQLAVK